LQAASYQGHEITIRFLVENGADVNLTGGSYGSALQAAKERGHQNIEQYLIDNGGCGACDRELGRSDRCKRSRGFQYLNV
ncbi:hypothetical protein FPQ18DRAFT_258474, partial [Pyronema domesticum]